MGKTITKAEKSAKSAVFKGGDTSSHSPAANDSLYSILEARYGGGFAQWIVDGLHKRTSGKDKQQ